MANLFFDGFNKYRTPAEMAAQWPTVGPSVSLVDVPGWGRVAHTSVSTTNGRTLCYFSEVPNNNVIIFGFGFYTEGRGVFADLVSSTGSTRASLRLNTTGHIEWLVSGGVRAVSNSPLPLAERLYIEAEVGVATTATGYLKLWVNNRLFMEADDIVTAAFGGFGGLSIRGTANSVATRWSDVYVNNTAGSVDNTRWGPISTALVMPSADNENDGWEPSEGGALYPRINDPLRDDADGSYISASLEGSVAKFEHPGIGLEPLAVNVFVRARKDGEGVNAFRAGLVSDDTATESPLFAPGDTFETYVASLNTDPATGQKWTKEGLNAALLQLRTTLT